MIELKQKRVITKYCSHGGPPALKVILPHSFHHHLAQAKPNSTAGITALGHPLVPKATFPPAGLELELALSVPCVGPLYQHGGLRPTLSTRSLEAPPVWDILALWQDANPASAELKVGDPRMHCPPTSVEACHPPCLDTWPPSAWGNRVLQVLSYLIAFLLFHFPH